MFLVYRKSVVVTITENPKPLDTNLVQILISFFHTTLVIYFYIHLETHCKYLATELAVLKTLSISVTIHYYPQNLPMFLLLPSSKGSLELTSFSSFPLNTSQHAVCSLIFNLRLVEVTGSSLNDVPSF